MTSQVVEGQLEYRARAFEQDADMAIRGDVVRALIELITNADDAYGGGPGAITVTVAPNDEPGFPLKILVRDSARGLDAGALLECFAVLGGEKSADEAGHARGLLGRGAKDVASLGRITFSTIKDGRFSRLIVWPNARYRRTDADRNATEADRDYLHLEEGENGLTNEVWVKEKIKVPKAARLQEQLASHAQLRNLVSRRDVFLKDDRTSPPFFARLVAPERRGEVIIDKEIAVVPFSKPAHLVVRRLPSKANGSISPYSEQGIIVSSGVSSFENTWFDLERMPESDFFAGEIDAPEIADVIRAYDRDEQLGGPSRLLSRDRDGLVKTHPYRLALARAVSEEIKPHFESLAATLQAEKKQGADLDRALRLAGAALKEQLNKILEEMDEEEPEGGDSEVEDLVVIPPRRVARPGEAVTLTIRSSELPSGSLTAEVEVESREGVINGVAASPETWAKHDRLDAYTSHVYVSAGSEQGTAVVRISVDGKVVRATLIVAAPDAQEVDAPGTLVIEPSSVTVAPGRGKNLLARAPLDTVGLTIRLVYEGNPLRTVPESVVLKASPNGLWAQAPIRLEAGLAQGGGTLTGTIDGYESAQVTVDVSESAGRGGLAFKFELSGHKGSSHRAVLLPEDGLLKVTLYPAHASYSGLFGPYSEEESKFEREDSPAARAVIAEVISSELATYLTERDYTKRPDYFNDASRVFNRERDIRIRFLGIAHRALEPTGLS